jgi:hypothetical protein
MDVPYCTCKHAPNTTWWHLGSQFLEHIQKSVHTCKPCRLATSDVSPCVAGITSTREFLRALAVSKESLHLTLTDLEISVLSPSITDVTQLTSLRLDNNRIRELPQHLFNMTNLTALSIKDNNINYIPVELLQLTNLTRLNLENNDLAAFPREIVTRGLSVLFDYLSKIR